MDSPAYDYSCITRQPICSDSARKRPSTNSTSSGSMGRTMVIAMKNPVFQRIIELLEHGISDFFIVATDINKEVLLQCKRGVYPRERMKEMGDAIVNKYFTKVGGTQELYRVKPFLKEFFILKKLNLIDDLRFERQFDYIFCRNVLIYFDLETQRRVLDNLLANLKDLGYLFVGHSESLLHVTGKIEAVFSSVYNKKL